MKRKFERVGDEYERLDDEYEVVEEVGSDVVRVNDDIEVIDGDVEVVGKPEPMAEQWLVYVASYLQVKKELHVLKERLKALESLRGWMKKAAQSSIRRLKSEIREKEKLLYMYSAKAEAYCQARRCSKCPIEFCMKRLSQTKRKRPRKIRRWYY